MKIEKRDGRVVDYEGNKIVTAVAKAMKEVKGIVNLDMCHVIEEEVFETVKSGNYPKTVEGIQDSVENTLMSIPGLTDVAKAYILYRARRSVMREKGWVMTELQSDIYNKKYRYSNESFDEFVTRVSAGNDKIAKLIKEKKFLPAGRILAARGLNSKDSKACYSNCFVITPPEDNIESIFETASKMARTYAAGGGCGTNLNNLRPEGARVQNSAKETTGAASFAELYSLTTGLIGQKNRRGALMLSMSVEHPDIQDFIEMKNDLNAVTKANLSVMVTDDFMQAVIDNKDWTMTFEVEATGERIIKTIPARELMNVIAKSAHRMAEPGMLYWDNVQGYHINSENDAFEYVSTNPCQPKGELILTENGYVPIENITDHIMLQGKKYASTRMFKTGTKDIYKVTLEDGSSRRMTDNHVITSVCGDKPLNELSVGDKVVVDYNPIFDSTIDDIREYQKGIMLGYLTAKADIQLGEQNHYDLSLNKSEFVLEDVLTALLSEYQANFAFQSHTENHKVGQITSKEGITHLAKDLFLKDKYDKYSFDVYKMSKSMKLGFIRALFTFSGKVGELGLIDLVSFNEQFLAQTQTMLREFGIYSDLTVLGNATEEYKILYTLAIHDMEFVDIALLTDVKQISLIARAELENSTVIKNKKLSQKIIAIELDGHEDVYDITVDEVHHYNTNGLVVHNCGEKPLPKGGSCLLASFNLSEYVFNGEFDYITFERDVREATIFMNDLLEEGIEFLPLEEQRISAERFRQLGLGIMGMADALIKMELKYGELESIEVMEKIMGVMANAALQESSLIAAERGSYDSFDAETILKSEYIQTVATEKTKKMIEENGLRNAELLSIAPTGSISTMWGVSGGAEPIFQNSYTRKTESMGTDGKAGYYKVYTPIVKEYMEEHELIHESELPDYFVVAPKLDYKKRIAMQAVLQKYVDSAISSTVNLPNEFTVEEVTDLYIEAWKAGLKGITIYRDGCEREGILTTDNKTKVQQLRDEMDKAILESLGENPDTCPMCGGELMHSGGCTECQDCGYSPCAI